MKLPMRNPRIWSQSPARRFFVGPEPTHNPSPAAAFLLGMAPEATKYHRVGEARRRILGRRHPRTGNPVPAALIAGLAKFGPLKGLFKKPSEAQAKEVAGAMVAAAVAGNLTAAKAIQERTTFGIAKERAVWQSALARVPPTIMALVKKYSTQIPGVDHTNPATAAASAAASAVDGLALEEEAKQAVSAAAAARKAAAREEDEEADERESRLLGVGESVLTTLAGRSRSPAKPKAKKRKKRKPARRR